METKRIVDKAIACTKELISLLDEELRTTNLNLCQEFNDEIEILYNLKDKLYEEENKIYNPPEVPEYALVGYEKDNYSFHEELYYSADIYDVLKKAEHLKPLCNNNTLRNSKGNPYVRLEVIYRLNSDMVYWRFHKDNY